MANPSITTVQFVYKRVVDETIKNSRETFLNEGIEESVLQELRTLWESKVSATRAVEPAINPPDYIPRGQIYKYNYRNQPQQSNIQATPAAAAGNVPFPGHLSAFIPQTMPNISSRGQPASVVRANIHAAAQNVRPNMHNAAIRPTMHNVPQNMRPNMHSAAPSVRPNMHNAPPSVRPGMHNAPPTVRPGIPPSSSSQYPTNIPFPSLSGVTTVTKKEFNNASDSIQVDGCGDVSSSDDDVINTPHDVINTSHDVTDDTADVAHSSSKRKHKKKKEKKKPVQIVVQLDGGVDSDDDPGEFVDSEESDEEDDNDDTDEEIDVGGERNYDMNDINNPSTPVEEDDPLNSGDDDSDDAGNTEFEATDNVVVCLFDKVTRSKNKWKLNLKEGVMNIGGKDHVFHKAIGDGEW